MCYRPHLSAEGTAWGDPPTGPHPNQKLSVAHSQSHTGQEQNTGRQVTRWDYLLSYMECIEVIPRWISRSIFRWSPSKRQYRGVSGAGAPSPPCRARVVHLLSLLATLGTALCFHLKKFLLTNHHSLMRDLKVILYWDIEFVCSYAGWPRVPGSTIYAYSRPEKDCQFREEKGSKRQGQLQTAVKASRLGN